MFAAVWILGLLLLGLWSLTMWATYAGWEALMGIPWEQAAERMQALELPPALEAWIGSAWREWVEAAGPGIEWLVRVLQGSAGWLESALPLLIRVVWAVGALVLLVLTALAAGAASWWRRRRAPRPV